MFGHDSDVGVYGAGFTSSSDCEAGADLAIGAPPARRRLWLVALCVGALLLCLGLAPSDALADLNWGTGVEAALPANAGSNPDAFLQSVSCASAGNCAAVGLYNDSSGNAQGLLLSESSGTWGTGVEAALPANASSSYPNVFLYSVSCASAGNCAAVGYYFDSSGHQQGLLLTESSGTWATGVEAALPANASSSNPQVFLYSVSCASAGNCATVGYYFDSSGHRQGLLLNESSGTWGTGVEAALPANASSSYPNVFLYSVSCASAGNCAAVGSYPDSSGHQQGLLLDESSGSWSTGVEAALPANAYPSAELNSVSCASAGNCGAVGYYYDSSAHVQGLLLDESSGTWGTGVEAALPANASSNPLASPPRGLQSVSCASAGNCAAVGSYYDSSGNAQGLLLSESLGTWGTGVEAAPPANASSNPFARLQSVSCASAGNCAAVGRYNAGLFGNFRGLLLGESSGTWGTGVEAALPANSTSGAGLNSVSCASAGKCAAVGYYTDSSGSSQGLLIDAGDTTAPTTKITLSPGSPNGTGGWYVGSVGVSVTANDPDDSVAQTRCVLDPASVPASFDDLPNTPCSMSSVSTDGQHTIYAASEDSNGNKETPVVSTSFKIDQTPPSVAPTVSPSTIYLNQSGVIATANASDATSGVASQSCDATDTSTAGDHTVTCTATDNAGNTNSATIHYTVQYQILGLSSLNSKWKARSTTPVKVALADVNGTRIPDSEASGLASACRVTFRATGAQTLAAQCMKYDATNHQFIYDWKLGSATGAETIYVGVFYPSTTTKTTQSAAIAITR